METQFVTDIVTGEPIRVNLSMEYKEYLKLAKKNHLPLTPTSTIEERSPLPVVKEEEQYPTGSLFLIESVRDILGGLVALAGREHIKEMAKPNPDQNRIAELIAIRNEAHKVNRDPEIHKSDARMEEIIAKYGAILRAEKKKLL